MDDLKEGDTIKFCLIENRDYRVITSLRKVSSKDDPVIRMSSLSSASRLVSGIRINLKERKKLALDTAEEFEGFVKRGEIDPRNACKDVPFPQSQVIFYTILRTKDGERLFAHFLHITYLYPD